MKEIIRTTAVALLAFLISNIAISQSNPGGLSESNLVFWLKADVGVDTTTTTLEVTSWNDQSATGGNENAAQGTVADQPFFIETSLINNLPSIDFDGADHFLEVNADDDIHADGSSTNITARSIFVVFRTSDLSGTGIQPLYTQGNTTGAASTQDGFGIYLDDDLDQVFVGAFEDGTGYYQGTSVTANTTYVIELEYSGSGTSVTGYLNNASFGSVSDAVLNELDFHSTTSSKIGGVNADGFVSSGGSTVNSYFDGLISEIVYYNAALSDAERIMVANYLGSKYQIVLDADQFYSDATFSSEVSGIGRVSVSSEITTMASSSGALTIDVNSGSLADGDYILVGHDNTDHALSSSDLPSGVPFRYSREWEIQLTSVPTVDVDISVSSSDAGFGAPDLDGNRTASDYVLLYRASSAVDFSTVTTASTSLSSDEIVFTVANVNLLDGQYTVGIVDELTYYSFITGNWETSTNWTIDPSGTTFVNPLDDFPDDLSNEQAVILNGRTITITTDGIDLSQLEVQSGGIVNVAGTTSHNFTDILGAGTIQVEGNGGADNFPSGTTTNANGFGTSEGGTVEFAGTTGFTVASSNTFNNVTFSNTGGVTLTATPFTALGNMTVDASAGLQINDNATATTLSISVGGDFTVNGTVTTGVEDASDGPTLGVETFHQFDLDGDLTVNTGGSLSFTNLTASELDDYPADGSGNEGIVELIINNQTSDQVITCNGTSNFYRIEVDKGNTANTLSISASSTANFNLFGRVAFSQDFTTEGSIANPRALGLESGKLELGSNIVISELTSGTLTGVLIDGGETDVDGCSGANCVESYVIDSDAELSLISDAQVTNARSAGMHIFGTLRVEDDAILSKGDGRCSLILDGSGTIAIEGGNEVSVSQIHQFDENSRGTFRHTAGTINIEPAFNDETIVDVNDIENYALLGLPFSDMSIIMLDEIPTNPAIINIDVDGNAPGTDICAPAAVNVNGTDYDGDDLLGMNAGGNNEALAIFIGIDEENASITGGTINVVIFDNIDGMINSTISLYNFSMQTNGEPDDALGCTNANAEFQLSEVDAIAGISAAQAILPINTLNNFSILDSGVGGGGGTDYDPGGQDLEVGGNFTLEDNVRYDPDATTLFLNGAGDQLISVNEPNPAPQGGGEGILDYGFNKVVFNGSGTVTLDGPDRGGPMVSFGVRESLVINDGVTFRDGGVIVLLGDSVTNYGTHTGSGYLEFDDPTDGGEGNTNGAGADDIFRIVSDGTGVFGNIRIDDDGAGDEFVEISSDITITGELDLNDGLLDIATYQVTFDSDTATIIAPDGTQDGDFSVTDYIRTDGNASDGGVRLYIDGATANPGAFTVPIGTDASGADRYTPANIDLESVSDDGYIQIAVADGELATTDTDPLSDMVTHYWRIRNSDFTTLPTVTQLVLTYDDADAEDLDGVGGVEEASFIPGYTEDNDDADGDGSSFSNIYEDELASGGAAAEDGVDEGNNTITFNGPDDVGFTLFNGNFTAGEQDRFEGDPEVYYSRTTGSFVGSNIAGSTNWEDPDNWSTVELFGAAASDYPQAGDIAIISPDASDGDFEFMIYGISDDFAGGSTGNVSVAQLIINNLSGAGFVRLKIDSDATVDFGVVSGNDEIQALITTAATPTINGDFGEFNSNGENGAQFDYYAFGTDGTVTLPANITEYPILRLEALTTDGFIFELPADVSAYDVIVDGTSDLRLTHDLTITEDLQLGSFEKGDLIFGGDNGAVTLTIGGDLDLEEDSNGFGSATVNDITVDDSGGGLEHRMIINGNVAIDDFESSGDALESFDLFTDNAGGDNVILEFQGDANSTFDVIDANGVTPDLYRLVINKEATPTEVQINDNFTLGGETNGATKALELTQGTLVLSETNLDLELSSGGGDFEIPSTSVLQVDAGTVSVTATGSGDGNGLNLAGSLILNGADANVILQGETSANARDGDNYLEFNTSGSATLTVNQGELVIGSQLRQQTTNTSGIINYTQTGGTVVVGANTAATYLDERAVFSIPNTSSFTFNNDTESPTLAIISSQDAPVDGTLVISSSATLNIEDAADVVIDFGVDGATNPVNGEDYTTPDAEVFEINSPQALPRVRINDNGTSATTEILRTAVQALDISSELEVGTDTEFQTSGFGLDISGNLVDNGTFTPNLDDVNFNGTTQTISGTAAEVNFYNLNVSSGTSFDTSIPLDIDNNLIISNGEFDDNGNTVSVQGEVTLSSTASLTGVTNSGGINMNGTATQTISTSGGSIDFFRLLVDNSAGVDLTADATINDELVLNNGVLEISDNLLTIANGARIEDNGGLTNSAGNFNSSRMISVNGSLTTNGLSREFAAGSSVELFYPVGVGTAYTPVEASINTTTSSASITVRPINSVHPSVTLADGALDYYWIVNTSTDLTDFDDSSITFTYLQDDVTGTESSYTNARLDGADWQKILPTDNDIDISANTFSWYAPGTSGESALVDDANFSGQYTVGENDAVPDELTTFRTTSGVDVSADFGSATNWEENSTGSFVAAGTAPSQGTVIQITDPNDVVTLGGATNLNVFSTEINGTLNVGSTAGNSFGEVTGTGTLVVEGNIPLGGNFDAFFTSTGGSLTLGGDATSYTAPSDFEAFNTLTIDATSSSTITIPAVNYSIGSGGIVINNGATLDNSTNNTDVTITDGGGLNISDGAFIAGSSGTIAIAGDLVNQEDGTYTATGATLDVDGNIDLQDGATGSSFNAGTGAINLAGNLTLAATATFDNGNGTLVLDGTSAQTISGNFTSTNKLYDFTVNKGSDNVTIDNSTANTVAIANTLTLTNGDVITDVDNSAILLVCEGGTISVDEDPSTNTSIVDGALDVELALGGEETFPVGKSNTLNPFNISNTSAGSSTWRVEYFEDPATNEGAVDDFVIDAGSSAVEVRQTEYWEVTLVSGTAATTADVSLDISGIGLAQSSIDNGLLVMQYDVDWIDLGSGTTSGTTDNAQVSSGTSATFATLGVAEYFIAGDDALTLPVELIYFAGEANDAGDVLLNWTTASELNNDFFEIQRSANGDDFEAIGRVEGNGTTNEEKSYSFLDRDAKFGINYYRLKQVDFDGAIEFHPIIQVENTFFGREVLVTVYPNPATEDNLNVRITSFDGHTAVLLTVVDITGRKFYQEQVNGDLIIDRPIKADKTMAAGLYFVIVEQGSYSVKEKFFMRK